MRALIRTIFSTSNASFTRINTLRYASNDAEKKGDKAKAEEKKPKPKDDTQTKPKPPEVIKYVSVEKLNNITTINICNIKTCNSLNEATLRQLGEALDEFEKDDKAKVLVINGEGGTFSSGFDIKELDEKGYNTLKDAARRLARRPICTKPTVAAVSGYAVGEGFQLALACDLRVIEESACMGFLERRFGVPQTLAGDRRLTSLVGLSRALDLLLTGRLVSGAEADRMGLAAKLTVCGTALGEAVKLAKCIAKFPQSALIMDKLGAVNSVLNPNSEESMRDEAIKESLLGVAMEDIKVGVKKFQEGIGKHGKFANLSQIALKDWEVEESKKTEKKEDESLKD